MSDEGGGIPRSGMPNIWTYLYTTARSPLPDVDPHNTGHVDMSALPAVLAGYGCGLPLSRLYARYFGGDMQLLSMVREGGAGGAGGARTWGRPCLAGQPGGPLLNPVHAWMQHEPLGSSMRTCPSQAASALLWARLLLLRVCRRALARTRSCTCAAWPAATSRCQASGTHEPELEHAGA